MTEGSGAGQVEVLSPLFAEVSGTGGNKTVRLYGLLTWHTGAVIGLPDGLVPSRRQFLNAIVDGTDLSLDRLSVDQDGVHFDGFATVAFTGYPYST